MHNRFYRAYEEKGLQNRGSDGNPSSYMSLNLPPPEMKFKAALLSHSPVDLAIGSLVPKIMQEVDEATQHGNTRILFPIPIAILNLPAYDQVEVRNGLIQLFRKNRYDAIPSGPQCSLQISWGKPIGRARPAR